MTTRRWNEVERVYVGQAVEWRIRDEDTVNWAKGRILAEFWPWVAVQSNDMTETTDMLPIELRQGDPD